MARNVKISKVGKSTIVELTESSTSGTETFVFNKSKDLTIRAGIIRIIDCDVNLQFKLEEIENNLSATTPEGYVAAAAAIFLFSNQS
jgi:hypothetical protein